MARQYSYFDPSRSLRMRSSKSLAEWYWVQSMGFRTSDPQRTWWVKVATEMSSLVSMLFQTFLNCLKFIMKIFDILVYLIILPTKYLRTSSAWHRTPMGPRLAWGRAEVSECLGTQRWWCFNLYSIRGTRSLFPHCMNIPQCCHFVTGSYIRV